MLCLLPRVAALKGKSFMLEALRMQFPDGTLKLGVEATSLFSLQHVLLAHDLTSLGLGRQQL